MAIHQALITPVKSYDHSIWSLVESTTLSTSDNAFEVLTDVEENDLVFIVAGADDETSFDNFSVTGYTTVVAEGENSVGIYVGYKVHGTASTLIVDGNSAWDQAICFVMRSSSPSSSYTVQEVASYFTPPLFGFIPINESPTHNNENVDFIAGDLALLLAWQDDDNASPMNPPSVSTDIVEDVGNSTGSVAAAFRSIPTTGTYSWGAWSTTGTDRTQTLIIKVN